MWRRGLDPLRKLTRGDLRGTEKIAGWRGNDSAVYASHLRLVRTCVPSVLTPSVPPTLPPPLPSAAPNTAAEAAAAAATTLTGSAAPYSFRNHVNGPAEPAADSRLTAAVASSAAAAAALGLSAVHSAEAPEGDCSNAGVGSGREVPAGGARSAVDWGGAGKGEGGEGAAVGSKHTARWRVFTDRGRELFSQGRLRDAERYLQRAIEEAKAGFGPSDPHVASSCNNLAELYRVMGEWEAAERLFQEAAERFRAVEMPLPLAATLHNLGGLYLQQAQLGQGQVVYSQPRNAEMGQGQLGQGQLGQAQLGQAQLGQAHLEKARVCYECAPVLHAVFHVTSSLSRVWTWHAMAPCGFRWPWIDIPHFNQHVLLHSSVQQTTPPALHRRPSRCVAAAHLKRPLLFQPILTLLSSACLLSLFPAPTLSLLPPTAQGKGAGRVTLRPTQTKPTPCSTSPLFVLRPHDSHLLCPASSLSSLPLPHTAKGEGVGRVPPRPHQHHAPPRLSSCPTLMLPILFVRHPFALSSPPHPQLKAKELGESHPDYANTMFHLAEVFRRLGRREEAHAVLRGSVKILEGSAGSRGTTAMARRMMLLAQMLVQSASAPAATLPASAAMNGQWQGQQGQQGQQKQGDRDSSKDGDAELLREAERLQRRAIHAVEMGEGTEAPALSGMLASLATTLEKQGRLEEARDALLRSLHLRQAALGLDHFLVSELLTCEVARKAWQQAAEELTAAAAGGDAGGRRGDRVQGNKSRNTPPPSACLTLLVSGGFQVSPTEQRHHLSQQAASSLRELLHTLSNDPAQALVSSNHGVRIACLSALQHLSGFLWDQLTCTGACVEAASHCSEEKACVQSGGERLRENRKGSTEIQEGGSGSSRGGEGEERRESRERGEEGNVELKRLAEQVDLLIVSLAR
ncbi:unnamed protein product [Closterium sp. NIES-53]